MSGNLFGSNRTDGSERLLCVKDNQMGVNGNLNNHAATHSMHVCYQCSPHGSTDDGAPDGNNTQPDAYEAMQVSLHIPVLYHIL